LLVGFLGILVFDRGAIRRQEALPTEEPAQPVETARR